MAKKLLFICMLTVLSDAILATGDHHSLLTKRSHDEMNSSAVTFERSKRQAINIKDNDDVLAENAGALLGGASELLPVEDSSSRSSNDDQETFYLFKRDISTGSNYANSREANKIQTQFCEHAAEILGDHSNEELEAFVRSKSVLLRNREYSLPSASEVLPDQSSSSGAVIYGDDSLSSVLSSLEEELSRSDLVQDRPVYVDGFDSFDDDFPNSSQIAGTTESLESHDLDLLAEELLREESANQQHELPINDRQLEQSEDRNQAQQLENIRYFCPDCFNNLICKKAHLRRHHATCSLKQSFKTKDGLAVRAPLIIKHKSADIYCLHPVYGAIYVQNSKGLDPNNFTINPDGSFNYEDIDKGVAFWDKFGFDRATRERLDNILETEFNIISRRPEDGKKEYFECHIQGCSELVGNKNYATLKDHVKYQHNGKKSCICHYKDCNHEHGNKKKLFDRHEIKHLGIEFICPSCSQSSSSLPNLKHSHIKNIHPEMYAEKYKK